MLQVLYSSFTPTLEALADHSGEKAPVFKGSLHPNPKKEKQMYAAMPLYTVLFPNQLMASKSHRAFPLASIQRSS